MSQIAINEFNACQKCGECCRKAPCDLIPEDLSPLQKKFNTDLAAFFKKYLIALPVASPKFAEEILMMVPVRVNNEGVRTDKLLADKEYLETKGTCIFLNNNECSIHDVKPFGGKYLKCRKITGTSDIQLPKSQYFDHWKNHQNLFEKIFPGYDVVIAKLQKIFDKKNMIFNSVGKNAEYCDLHKEQEKIIKYELFPLFNGKSPQGGYSILTQ